MQSLYVSLVVNATSQFSVRILDNFDSKTGTFLRLKKQIFARILIFENGAEIFLCSSSDLRVNCPIETIFAALRTVGRADGVSFTCFRKS